MSPPGHSVVPTTCAVVRGAHARFEFVPPQHAASAFAGAAGSILCVAYTALGRVPPERWPRRRVLGLTPNSGKEDAVPALRSGAHNGCRCRMPSSGRRGEAQ
jgi:hypothetical protein